LSQAAVYVHYQSKMALLIEISRIGHEAVLAHVTDAISGLESPPDRVRAFTEASVTWQTRFHTLGRVTNYQFEELSEDGLAIIRPLRRRFTSLLQAELRRGVDSGDFSVSDVPGTARAILSLGIDVSRWYSPRGRTPMEHVGRLYGELALRMVRPWAE
jgi:AcrR family transcriptional regulator